MWHSHQSKCQWTIIKKMKYPSIGTFPLLLLVLVALCTKNVDSFSVPRRGRASVVNVVNGRIIPLDATNSMSRTSARTKRQLGSALIQWRKNNLSKLTTSLNEDEEMVRYASIAIQSIFWLCFTSSSFS